MPYATHENPTVEPELQQANDRPNLVAQSASCNLTRVAAALATVGVISALTWAVFRTRDVWSPGVWAFVLIGPLASVLAFGISAFASPWRVPCAARKWLVPFTVCAVCLSAWATFGFVVRIFAVL